MTFGGIHNYIESANPETNHAKKVLYVLLLVLTLLSPLEFREAIRINPNYAEAHNSLGSAFQDQGKLDDAIVEYREAIRIDPNLAEPHYLLGEALRQQGNR